MRRARTAAGLAAVVVLTLGACSDDPPAHPKPQTPKTLNPRISGAVQTYLAFVAAVDAARQHPHANGRPAPGSAADFTPYAVAPLVARTEASISALAREGVAWHGTPPTHVVGILSTRVDAPLPAMTLGDCANPSPTWQTQPTGGDAAESAPAGPQHRLHVEMAQTSGSWKVVSAIPDRHDLCG